MTISNFCNPCFLWRIREFPNPLAWRARACLHKAPENYNKHRLHAASPCMLKDFIVLFPCLLHLYFQMMNWPLVKHSTKANGKNLWHPCYMYLHLSLSCVLGNHIQVPILNKSFCQLIALSTTVEPAKRIQCTQLLPTKQGIIHYADRIIS